MTGNRNELQTLLQKINRFVYGNAQETVDLGHSVIGTMSAIANQFKNRKYYQYLVDYKTLALANQDLATNTILNEGGVIRVFGEADKRMNGLYRVEGDTLYKTDFWELYDVLNITENSPFDFIKRESTKSTFEVFTMRVQNPLVGQSKLLSFDLQVKIDSFDPVFWGLKVCECGIIFGVDPAGNPIASFKTHSVNKLGTPEFTDNSLLDGTVSAIQGQDFIDFSVRIQIDGVANFQTTAMLTNLPKRKIF